MGTMWEDVTVYWGHDQWPFQGYSKWMIYGNNSMTEAGISSTNKKMSAKWMNKTAISEKKKVIRLLRFKEKKRNPRNRHRESFITEEKPPEEKWLRNGYIYMN